MTITFDQSFHYRGRIPASKSILNRLLILRSFSQDLEIIGESQADDVVKMKSALRQFSLGEMADCGAAGTTLRFLALRASRVPGTHHLSGSLRLFERPQSEIGRVLNQLGCDIEMGPQRMTIRSQGWKVPEGGLKLDRSVSSQFASAVLLSSWDLDRDLLIEFEGEAVSESYFAMTEKIVRDAGMQFATEDGRVRVPAGARIHAKRMEAEIDLSSAFAVAGLAVASGGKAEFLDWPEASVQPDRVFAEILREMGCRVHFDAGSLIVKRDLSAPLKAVDVNLRDAPDLFPVLSVLAALAPGTSRLHGAPHLAHKESNRVAKSRELVEALGRKTRLIPGGLEISGSILNRINLQMRNGFKYQTDHDHRLAMAANVAKHAGLAVEILDPSVVEKSFPEFWSIAESQVTSTESPQ